MIKHLGRSLAILLLTSAVAAPSETARRALLGRMFTQLDYFGFPGETADPFPCSSAVERSTYYSTTAHLPYVCNGTSWTAIGSTDANVALSNLAGVAINTALLPGATGTALGSTAKPFSNVFIHLSGTFGTGDWSFGGTPTGHRVAMLPGDVSFTIAGIDIANAFSAVDTFGASAGAANSVALNETAGAITFEGATSDAFETRLDVTDPTVGDQTYHVPNAGAAVSDTLVALTLAQTLTNKTLSGNIITGGATPAVANTGANSCGTTAAAIAGTNAAGIITVGATAGTSCTVTFTIAATTRRQCWCSNETTLANVCNTHYTDTTHTNVVGTFVAGDVVNYGCLTY